jgi:hypothetical protein
MIDVKELGIRIGVEEDLTQLLQLAMMAAEENGYVDPNPEKVALMMWGCLVQQIGLIGVISNNIGEIEGFVLLEFCTSWYSDEKVIEERMIFVKPAYRSAKGGRARKLCEFSKYTSDTLGLPLIIGMLSNNRTEAKIRLYERQFGKCSGVYFLHNAKTGYMLDKKA